MSERLNTQDLIDLLINRHGLERKEAENFVKEFFSLIEEGLEKDKSVKIKGLGTFKLVDVESRESVNVNTGERIEIQGHTKISFVPDTTLRDIINKPFSHFETVILNDNVVFNDIAQDSVKPLNTVETEALEEKMEEEVVSEETISTPSEEITEKIVTEEKPVEETIVDSPIVTETILEADTEANATEESVSITERSETVEEPQFSASENKKKSEKESSKNKVLIIVVILTILLCGILLFFTYYSDIFPEKKKQPVTPVIENSAVTDSLTTDFVEEPVTTTPVSAEPTVDKLADKPTGSNIERSNAIPFSQIPVKPDSTSYEIIGTKTTHTIKEGETLIRISYRYYGTKDLYPYLIVHNRSIIKNPNSVPLGTTINIPELKKK